MIHTKAPPWNGQLKYLTGGLKPVSRRANLTLSSTRICTLCFVRYLTLNIGLSMNGAVMISNSIICSINIHGPLCIWIECLIFRTESFCIWIECLIFRTESITSILNMYSLKISAQMGPSVGVCAQVIPIEFIQLKGSDNNAL